MGGLTRRLAASAMILAGIGPTVVQCGPANSISSPDEVESTLAKLVDQSIELALAAAPYAERPLPQSERRARQAALDAQIRNLGEADRATYVEQLRLGSARPRVFRVASGALLLEDFESGLNPARWPSAFPEIDGVQVEVVNGILRIHGAPTFAEERVGAPFTGIVSKVFPDRSVVLRARVRVADLDAASTAAATVHLCGSVPDYFVECMLGFHDGVGPGWFFSGHGSDADPAPAQLAPDALEDWSEVDVFHNTDLGVSTARVRGDDRWRPFPETARAYLSSTKVELKARVDPGAGVIDFQFDDCRLYPSPADHPITLQLVSSLLGGHPVTEAEVEVRYRVSGSAHAMTVRSDESGRCEVYLPREADFPARLTFRVQSTGQLPSTLEIETERSLDGAYPGDVWAICPGFLSLAK